MSSYPNVTDDQLDSMLREAKAMLAIVKALRPLPEEKRAQVFAAAAALHGFAVTPHA